MKTTLEWPLIGSGDSVIIVNEEVRRHGILCAVNSCNQGGTAKKLFVPRYTEKVYLGIFRCQACQVNVRWTFILVFSDEQFEISLEKACVMLAYKQGFVKLIS